MPTMLMGKGVECVLRDHNAYHADGLGSVERLERPQCIVGANCYQRLYSFDHANTVLIILTLGSR